MAVFELEDYFGRISGIIFPRDFSKIWEILLREK